MSHPPTKGVFVVLGAGLFQGYLIRAAKAAGYQVLATDGNEHAACAREADVFLPIDFSDIPGLLAALEPYRTDLRLCATVGTDYSPSVAAVNQSFSLPGPRPEHAAVTTHKGIMRDFFLRHRLPQPAYTYTTDMAAALHWTQKNPCEFGYVIKPARNMGARGVMYLSEAERLSYAFEFAARYDKHGEIILEHYVPALELSVDALVFEGKVYITGLADRIIEIKDGHYFIETGHTMPSAQHDSIAKAVRQLLQNVADALSSQTEQPYHGALKGDLRLTPAGELVIGEIASRLSGGYMSTHTYPFASGNDLLAGFIELLEGRLPSFIAASRHEVYPQICVERAVIAEAGELQQITLPDPNSIAEKALLFQHFQVGDILGDLKNNIGKLANVLITENSREKAEAVFYQWLSQCHWQTGPVSVDRKILDRAARRNFNNNFCWVCKVCDGEHCASGVPGMGGRGDGRSFRDNLYALAEYKIIPRYLTAEPREAIEPDISVNLFGHNFSGPVLSAPITGSITNMGGSITEWDYALETGAGCQRLGLLPLFGDGASETKYLTGLYAIEQLGIGCPVFKPRADQKELMVRIRKAEQKGALAWGIDIDGVSFKTMTLKNIATRRKSLVELKELAACSQLPFFIKGVLSLEDAQLACEAGAAAIVVSNHGGRVLEAAPGSARVLPEISAFVKENYPNVTVLADGGVRSGGDIYKMLALGAQAVLIGRPIAIAAVGMGRLGVERLLRDYLEEFRQTMRVMGDKNLRDISPTALQKEKTLEKIV